MKKARDNAKLKMLLQRISQLCASNGVSLAMNGDKFAIIEHDQMWVKRLADADDLTRGTKTKEEELIEAAKKGSGLYPEG